MIAGAEIGDRQSHVRPASTPAMDSDEFADADLIAARSISDPRRSRRTSTQPAIVLRTVDERRRRRRSIVTRKEIY